MSDTIKTKRCSACKEIKPISGYDTRSDAKDGHRGNCKQCRRSQRKQYHSSEQGKTTVRLYRESGTGKVAIRKSRKRFEGSQKCKDGLKRYRQSEAGKIAIKRSHQTKEYKLAKIRGELKRRLKFPEKHRAVQDANNAVKAGKLPRPDSLECICGERAKHYHHEDYSKPLDVIPVCIKCHTHIHHKSNP